MKKVLFILAVVGFLVSPASLKAATISEATETCLGCHSEVTPGIVADWKSSVHSKISFSEAMKKGKLEREVSSTNVPENLKNVVVGCAECHTLNPATHKDTFEHNGFKVHVVVTPKDCAVCHKVEAEQYSKNLMSHAYGNLMGNPVYAMLVKEVNSTKLFEKGKVSEKAPNKLTLYDSCLTCHGTKVEVLGTKSKETEMGEMEFPVLSGWPNSGTGRINPDGSMGSCSSCHTRHSFSIEVARKPATCAQCHKGPDVPASKVYTVSKHGNIYASLGGHWNFRDVPWKVGVDFKAPTCATCHASLLVDKNGNVVAERTHQMNDRSPWRLFGIYAHPHEKSADTTVIKNKAGLPLPTELTGEPATPYLITKQEMLSRKNRMEKVCLACHASPFVNGHFAKLENTIKTTNESTLTATKILLEAWTKGIEKGLSQKDVIFNETIEKRWVEHWLFFCNSVRYASAMAGVDYGVFANGRWYVNKNIEEMKDLLLLKGGLK